MSITASPLHAPAQAPCNAADAFAFHHAHEALPEAPSALRREHEEEEAEGHAGRNTRMVHRRRVFRRAAILAEEMRETHAALGVRPFEEAHFRGTARRIGVAEGRSQVLALAIHPAVVGLDRRAVGELAE